MTPVKKLPSFRRIEELAAKIALRAAIADIESFGLSIGGGWYDILQGDEDGGNDLSEAVEYLELNNRLRHRGCSEVKILTRRSGGKR